MNRHPQEDLLQHSLHTLGIDQAGVMLHLLRCPRCQAKAERALAPAEQLEWTFVPRREIDYEEIWQRLEEGLDGLLQRALDARSEAAPRVEELLALSQDERLQLIREDVEHRSFSVADALLREARRQCGTERAQLAAAVAAIVEPPLPAETDLTAVSALGMAAWSEMGEVARSEGRREEAVASFARAAEFARDSADPLERAAYLHYLARLRRDQAHLDEALALLGRAAHLYAQMGVGQAVLVVRLERGWISLEIGEPEGALRDFARAAAGGRRHMTPDLSFRLVEGIAAAKLAQRQPAQALASVIDGRLLYRWPAGSREDCLSLALQGWLKQWTAPKEGAADLEAALDGFLALGDPTLATHTAVRLLRLDASIGLEEAPIARARDVVTAQLDAPLAPGLRDALVSLLESSPETLRPALSRVEALLKRPSPHEAPLAPAPSC